MVKKLFWQNPYQAELQTTVELVNGNDITVAETIFYAFSGAQESDEGTIGGKKVIKAEKQGMDIVYTMEDDHGLRPGDAVTMTIDWERRYKLMRGHLSAELILELINRALPGIEKIGAHISAQKARIDFRWHENISWVFSDVLQKAQALVDANYPITSAFSDEANQRRYWEIQGFARVACGGTHIKNTGEIGTLTLKRENRGKGQERVVILFN